MVRKVEDDRLLTAQQVAADWGYKPATIYRYGQMGLLPKVTVGMRGTRFRESDVKRAERELGIHATSKAR